MNAWISPGHLVDRKRDASACGERAELDHSSLIRSGESAAAVAQGQRAQRRSVLKRNNSLPVHASRQTTELLPNAAAIMCPSEVSAVSSRPPKRSEVEGPLDTLCRRIFHRPAVVSQVAAARERHDLARTGQATVIVRPPR